MKAAVIGVNFKSAPLAVRERLSFSSAQLPEVVARLSKRLPGHELVLVSTCNRTEVYAGGGTPLQLEDLIAALQPEQQGEQSAAALSPDAFYAKWGEDAAEHLLAVAASLDSMVVGETEILGQIKDGYSAASSQQTVGPVLHQMFQTAFRIAKRVHSETDIARGRVSVSSIAVEFSERIFEDIASKTVMIVGAGETAELALRSLVDHGVSDVLVLNRSPERAAALAEQYGGKAIPFNLLTDYIERADLVITSTSAKQALVHVEDVRAAVHARRGLPMLMIDLSVPRNIEPAVGDLEDVYLYHVDDLQKVAAENLAARRASVDAAWTIVREGAHELAVAFEEADVNGIMRLLNEQASTIRDEALRRCLARPHVSDLSEEGKKEIADMLDKVMRKMLASPRESLKRAARNGSWPDYSRVVHDLFGFRKDHEDKS